MATSLRWTRALPLPRSRLRPRARVRAAAAAVAAHPAPAGAQPPPPLPLPTVAPTHVPTVHFPTVQPRRRALSARRLARQVRAPEPSAACRGGRARVHADRRTGRRVGRRAAVAEWDAAPGDGQPWKATAIGPCAPACPCALRPDARVHACCGPRGRTPAVEQPAPPDAARSARGPLLCDACWCAPGPRLAARQADPRPAPPQETSPSVGPRRGSEHHALVEGRGADGVV